MSREGAGDRSNPVGSAGGAPLDQAAGLDGGGIEAASDDGAPSREEWDAIFAAMPNLARDIFIARHFHDLSMAEICEQTGLSRKRVRRQLVKSVEHLQRTHSGMELWRKHVAAMPAAYLEQVRTSLSMSVRAQRALERARALFKFNKRRHAGPPPDPETIARVKSAFARMWGLERDVLLSVIVDHLSYAEIGEKLGMSKEQVTRLVGLALYNADRNLRDPWRHWWRRWLW